MAHAQGSPLRIVSWNVNGLNTPENRSIVLRELHRLKAGVCLIQETYFRGDAIPRLRNRRYPQTYHSCTLESKSKGVSILIGHKTPCITQDTWTDSEGRILFVKGTLGKQSCTLATFYAPNSGQVAFIEGALEKLGEFSEGVLILGGLELGARPLN